MPLAYSAIAARCSKLPQRFAPAVVLFTALDYAEFSTNKQESAHYREVSDSARMQTHRNMIGPQVRRLRNQRGLSQREFAELLQRKGWNISRDTVAKIEDQRRWISDFETIFIADSLKICLTELFSVRDRLGKAKELIQRLERRLR